MQEYTPPAAELALDHIKQPSAVINPASPPSDIMAREEFNGLAQIDTSTDPPTHSIVNGLVTPLRPSKPSP
jgi:hypothetical protein